MITATSLKNPAVLAKIEVAIRNVALKGFSVDHVANKRGEAFLSVRRCKLKRNQPFSFFDRGGDVTDSVYKALRGHA